MKIHFPKPEPQNTRRRIFQMILNSEIQVYHPLLQNHRQNKKTNKKNRIQRQKKQGLMLFTSFKNYHKNVIEAPCVIGTSKNISSNQKRVFESRRTKTNNASLQSTQFKLNRYNTCQIDKITKFSDGQFKKRSLSTACQTKTSRKTILCEEKCPQEKDNRKTLIKKLNIKGPNPFISEPNPLSPINFYSRQDLYE